MSLSSNTLPLQLSTSSSDTHSSLVPARRTKNLFAIESSIRWDNEKKIQATYRHSWRPLKYEQIKMEKKTYPEKDCREKCKPICSTSKDIQYNLKTIPKAFIRFYYSIKCNSRASSDPGSSWGSAPGELARRLQLYMKINEEWYKNMSD